MFLDFAPPVRIIAVITLICTTLDVFADIVMCIKLSAIIGDFKSKHAISATYCYYLFTAISVVIYIVEVVDIIITLKKNRENRILTPLVKSLIIVLEEVPLPTCLLIIVLWSWAMFPFSISIFHIQFSFSISNINLLFTA